MNKKEKERGRLKDRSGEMEGIDGKMTSIRRCIVRQEERVDGREKRTE